MDNDRVRIYDLAKEVKLDNKEILAICHQLNIAVKSHSSTIRETDADRIRAVAEKHATVGASLPNKSAQTNPLTHSEETAKAQPKPHHSTKQQILEIRKPQTLEHTNPNSKELHTGTRSAQSSVETLTAPRPYSSPITPGAVPSAIAPTLETSLTQPAISTDHSEATLVKADAEYPVPTNQLSEILPEEKAISVAVQLAQPPNQPVPSVATTPGQSQDEISSANAQSVLELQQTQRALANQLEEPLPTNPKISVVTAQTQMVEEKRTQIAPEPKAVSAKLELAQPPSRPVRPVVITHKPSQEERPTQKRARPTTSEASSSGVNSGAPSVTGPAISNRVNKKSNKPLEITKETTVEKPVRPTAVTSKLEPGAAKPQSVIKLRRAKPASSVETETASVALLPKPAVGRRQTQVVGEEPEDLIKEEPSEELLERPKLPRKTLVGKKRSVTETEEERESLAKSGKAAAKLKRLKPIIEDEEDWEDTELDVDGSIQANLAVARPAKPQALVTKAASYVTAFKSKKSSRRSSDRSRHQEVEPKPVRPETLVVTGSMTVQELAQALGVPDTEIVKILFFKGMAVNVTQSLDISTITLVGQELETKIETAAPVAQARKVTEILDAEDLANLQRRPPVVTIMGHVDHGKTSLLDAIRQTKVAQGEAGGITQHIGAYHVNVEQEGKVQQVVFLDTPGHEAFTAMRARGTRVTDIAVLVVAADDGVQPQTVEAISHAKAAQVPIVVAINKIDKLDAQPDRVKQELTEYGLVSEEWGGDTIMVPVSALQKENLDTLLEMMLLVAEVSDLQANPNRRAKGTVIEANLDKTRGPVATFLVQNGTLRVGDIIVAGSALGKVRAMVDDRGRKVEAASPSFAVEVLGLSAVPAAGDEFQVFQSDKEARAIATQRAEKQRQSRLMQGRITLATLSAQAQEGKLKELNLILKGDVQGSVEAIVGSLKQLPQQEVQLGLLLAAPGEITETDIDLAAASSAVILGFNTTLASGARQAADEAGVDVREYNIIYKLLEDIQGAMEGLLEPELVEEPLGQVEVRAVFPVGRAKIAGCYVQSGKMLRNGKLRVRRGGKVLYEGTIDSLKRIKDDVKEVNAGYECGIGVDKFNDWVEGDIIEAFQMVTKRRTLSGVK